jgi:hypothetical protein
MYYSKSIPRSSLCRYFYHWISLLLFQHIQIHA